MRGFGQRSRPCYFAAYEMLPYSCSVLAVLLLARLLDLLP
ncbi:hypothetical protein HDA36_004681 [Nocardiopsis composta]|uniref:Uncharacterized protein n=1 Tax=Nocardiopsis composta TaxID=157465 RepID=A0A7W8QQ79_9ACTN|nr:hypothetical protein [Nocardiopsis composta]